MKTGKKKLAATIAVYAAVAILAVWFGVSYFSVKEFELDFHTYRVADKTGQYVRYVSKSGAPVVVRLYGSDRVLTIDGQDYRISEEEKPFGKAYQVRYPDGRTYTVSGQHGMAAFDENGELFMGGGIYVKSGGERILFGDENMRYHPTELVYAAYPQYHEPRGYPWLYWLSVLMFIFGWANFRYESVQRAMFWASLQWIWVENPEPSDFYFIMCKIGGFVAMLLAFIMFMQSLSRNYEILGLL